MKLLNFDKWYTDEMQKQRGKKKQQQSSSREKNSNKNNTNQITKTTIIWSIIYIYILWEKRTQQIVAKATVCEVTENIKLSGLYESLCIVSGECASERWREREICVYFNVTIGTYYIHSATRCVVPRNIGSLKAHGVYAWILDVWKGEESLSCVHELKRSEKRSERKKQRKIHTVSEATVSITHTVHMYSSSTNTSSCCGELAEP